MLAWTGGHSHSAGASVTGTSTLERGWAVFSEAEPTPCPASLLLVKLQRALCARVHQETYSREFKAAFFVITPVPIYCSVRGYVVTSHTMECCHSEDA